MPAMRQACTNWRCGASADRSPRVWSGQKPLINTLVAIVGLVSLLQAPAAEAGKLTWHPWSGVSEGRATPGAPVTAVPWGQRIALFVADPNGGVYTTGGSQGGFGPWASVSEGRTTPGAPVTAVPWGQRIALFVADPNGGVYTTGGDPQGGFGPWASVSEGGTKPGAPVTAVPWGQRIAVFVADPNGGVYTTGGDPQGGFGPWASVSEGRTTPGGWVTAVPWGQRIALFLADPNGGVYTTGGDPQGGFGPWASVSEGRTTPGAPVTAVPWGQRIALFLTDPNGGVYTTGGDPQEGFGPWLSVPGISAKPGSPITALRYGQGFALFTADPNGEIKATVGNPQGGWGPWAKVSEGRATPGALVTAVPYGQGSSGPGFALFIADPNGGIFATSSSFDPPARPMDLRVTKVTGRTIDVSWVHDTDDQDGFRVSFTGKRAGQGDHTGTTSLGPNARTASLTGLLSGYEYTIRLAAFNAAGELGSLAVVAKTPIVPETVTVNLRREEIIEGPIPCAGKYPEFGSVPAGHLLQIALPQISPVVALRFLKRGHSTQECSNPSAVVEVLPGTHTSPEQLTAIYGVPKSPFASTRPLPFVACLLARLEAPLPNFVPIELTIIYDGE